MGQLPGQLTHPSGRSHPSDRSYPTAQSYASARSYASVGGSARSALRRVGVLGVALLIVGAVFVPAATAHSAAARPTAAAQAADAAHAAGAQGVGEADSELMWSVRPTPKDDADTRPNFQYEMEAGSTVRDSFRIRNHGDEELNLAVYASDAVVTESGSLDLLPESEAPTDVGNWVRLAADEVTLPAGKFVDVPFTMSVPAKAESGDHSGGIVTSVVTRSSANGGQPVILDRRLGSRLQVRVVGDLAPSLEIADLGVDYRSTANPFGRGGLTVSYRVTNNGNVRMAAAPVIQVRGPAGLLGQTAVLERTAELLPGSSLTYRVLVPDIWPTLRPSVTLKLTPVATRAGDDFPDGLIFTSSADVTAVPWTSLAGIAAVVAGATWWRRRSVNASPPGSEASISTERETFESQAINQPNPNVDDQPDVDADPIGKR